MSWRRFASDIPEEDESVIVMDKNEILGVYHPQTGFIDAPLPKTPRMQKGRPKLGTTKWTLLVRRLRKP